MSTKEQVYTYEQDPRWAAVEAYQYPLLNPPSSPLQSALSHATENSAANGLRDISVYASQGKFIALQARIINAKHILEIGTLGAYSTIWLASAGADTKVTTIECDERTANIARENIEFAGLSDRVEVIVGEALEEMPKLARKQEPKFDFVFIDAAKDQYMDYFESAMKMTRSGGLIYADNMVRKGLLASEEEVVAGNKTVIGIRRLVEHVGNDERVEAVMLQTVGDKNYDGFLLALVK